MATSRNNEFLADDYSFVLGYDGQLISALYELDAVSTSKRMTLLERLKSTHPHLTERIRRLEEKQFSMTAKAGYYYIG